MSVPAMAGAAPADGRARDFRRWSLLMLPMLIFSAIVGAIVGLSLLGRRGLDGSEPMSVQGAYGWMVFALSTAIFMAPMVVGVILGLKAYRGAERSLGRRGMVIDGLILVVYPTLAAISLAGQ